MLVLAPMMSMIVFLRARGSYFGLTAQRRTSQSLPMVVFGGLRAEKIRPVAFEGFLDARGRYLVDNANSDNASDRCSGDQAEAGCEGRADVVFKIGENGDRIRPRYPPPLRLNIGTACGRLVGILLVVVPNAVATRSGGTSISSTSQIG